MPTALAQVDREKIYQWINELSSPETRENALLELSKKRESVPDLAPMLWHSFGTIAALLQVRQAAASAWCRACASIRWIWGGAGGISYCHYLGVLSLLDRVAGEQMKV